MAFNLATHVTSNYPYQMSKARYETVFYRHFLFSKYIALTYIDNSNLLASFKSLVNAKP
ncbi:MAG: hypothetical protein ACJAXS_002914 [Colwellia sp.]|jgi:hypothetical protein